MTISAVIPTFRRRDALLVALPNHLAMTGIDELVVVDDGSDDGTSQAVAALGLDRVTVIRHAVNRGLPAARNTGAAAAKGEWVIFLEDDCGFPDDYAVELLAVAAACGADVVGAPWVATATNEAARRSHERPVKTVGFLSPPWSFPVAPIETPFLPALALVRRDVFATLQYDERYTGNFYREETDFFVSAARAGFRVMLTPTTASWQLGGWDGGCKLPRLRYDTFATLNTWRFLRKHGRWLRSEGLLAHHPVIIELQFATPLVVRQLKRPLVALRDRARELRSPVP